MKREMTVSEMARKGGKAGRGKAKVRGSAAYYRALALLAAARRKANKDKLEFIKAQREPEPMGGEG